jgi:5'-3' exonuclease
MGELTLPDGTPTTGTFGFVNNLISILGEVNPTHCLVVYDAGGNFRKSQSEEYKANREKADDHFYREYENVKKDILPSFGIKVVGAVGFEADDVIYTVSQNLQKDFDEIIILTCDQDILQCVTDKVKVLLFNSAKKKVVMGVEEVVEKLGVPPSLIPELKAISGDPSDNISGVKGIGPKTAIKILSECGSDWGKVLSHPKIAPEWAKVNENLNLTKSVPVASALEISGPDLVLGTGTFQLVDLVLERYHFNTMKKRRKKILATLNINDGVKDAFN